MTALGRAALGAAIGALLVLIFHPVSRPYYVAYAGHLGDSEFLQQTRYLPENIRVLPKPLTLMESAYWFLVASSQIESGKPLQKTELRRLVEMAQAASKIDLDNAFWYQAEALFQWKLGENELARRAWKRGSVCLRWKDHQNVRLGQVYLGLSQEQGGAMGWQVAYLYHRRSRSFAHLIQRLSQDLLRSSSPKDEAGLLQRYEVIQNARLIRDFAQNIGVALYGVDMIEEASHTSAKSESMTPYKLVLARRDLRNRMDKVGLKSQAAATLDAFNTNDAWLAFVNPNESEALVFDLATRSLVAAAMPGTFVIIGVLAAISRILIWLLGKYRVLDWMFSKHVAPFAGFVAAAAVLWTTHLGYAALWTGICFAIYAMIPKPRKDQEESAPGPLFRFLLGVIGTDICLLGALFIVGVGTPGMRLLPYLGLPSELGPSSGLLLGLTGMAAGLVILLPAIWAFVRHTDGIELLQTALSETCSGIAYACLVIAILAGPIAVGLDRAVQEPLQRLFLNEPTFYLIRPII